MFLTDRKNIFRNNSLSSLILFFIFSFIWLWQYHGFQTIRYLEEIQLFRTDSLYFRSFLSQPGGIVHYIGAYLTQFFYYPPLGALLISISLIIISLLFYLICKKEGPIESFFILLCPTTLLLLFSFNRVIRESFLTGIILALCLFLFYLYIPRKIQQISGILLFVAYWFVAGSFSFIFSSLVLIQYLKNGKKVLPYIFLLVFCSFLIPYISYQYIYITSWEKLTLSFLTLDRAYPNKLYIAGILSIPVIYLLWTFYLKNQVKEINQPMRIISLYYVLLIGSMVGGFIFRTDISSEKKAQISHHATCTNWEEVLTISRSHIPGMNQANDLAIACFTNLALSEKGQLLHTMFTYNQPGTAGLFPGRSRDYSSYITASEVYYRIGLIPEAEHLAFEALVISTGKHGSRPLKRLVETNAIRKDTAGFQKYTAQLLQSPIHRKWAKKEIQEFYQATSGIASGNKPQSVICEDFFVNYTLPEYNLIGLFRSDESNKKLFEYLLASLLLNKDMETFTKFVNRYFMDLGYIQLPEHVEEAILLCKHILGNLDEAQFRKFPVTEKKTKELMNFYTAVNRGNTKKNVQEIKKNFSSTFWYYYYFTETIKYQPEPETPRY